MTASRAEARGVTTLFSLLDSFFYWLAWSGREALIEFFSSYREQMWRLEFMINDCL